MKKAGVSSILIAVTLLIVFVIAAAQRGQIYRIGILAQPGKSEARPDTNVTGLTNKGGAEIYGKRLELFKRVF